MALPRGAVRADAVQIAEELLASPSEPTRKANTVVASKRSASELALVHRFIG